MTLSYVHYKTFWAFMLAAMAVAGAPNDTELAGTEASNVSAQ